MQLYTRNEGNTAVNITLSTILLLAAVILFILFAVGVNPDAVHLGWIGLACFAAAFLLP